MILNVTFKENMKNLLITCSLIAMMACNNNSKTSNEAPKLKCDTVTVAMYDSTGHEIMVKELKCDTIKVK